ncbi:GNAT family N-acetyltransferase [Telluria beijingensis]|uniref:GNAT family N-acetyltransferase n=1 Tax=Telluria beijingensis TaxID=3068633 RepID=UPI0027963ABF|nr:N-acetyltransferase [Massilia sp. REN29]
MAIRHASLADVAALVEIENASFPGNRLDRRRFRYLLAHAHGALLVDAMGDGLRGYMLLLFRASATVARLYSIATHPAHLGCGVAARLVDAAERQARQHGHTCLRLEIRADNAASLALFRGRGYREFGRHAAYYHDGMDALRLQKPLPRIPAGALTG